LLCKHALLFGKRSTGIFEYSLLPVGRFGDFYLAAPIWIRLGGEMKDGTRTDAARR
jgi:hypothetical protein